MANVKTRRSFTPQQASEPEDYSGFNTPPISTLLQVRLEASGAQCVLPSSLADRLSAMNIPQMVLQSVQRYGPLTALGVQKGKHFATITYDEFGANIQAVAAALKKLGIERGDRVAIFSRNDPNWVIADVAIQATGAVTVPIYHTYTTKQVNFILRDSGATTIFFRGKDPWEALQPLLGTISPLKHVLSLETAPPDGSPSTQTFPDLIRLGEMTGNRKAFIENLKGITPSTLATIIYTSGTTGMPKGAMLSHSNILSNLSALSHEFPAMAGEVTLSGLPLSHVTERTSTYMYLYMGIQVLQSRGVEYILRELLEAHPHFIVQAPRFFEKVSDSVHRQIETQGFPMKFIGEWCLEQQSCGSPKHWPFLGPGEWIKEGKRFLADHLLFQSVRERLGGRMKFMVSGGAPLSADIGRFFDRMGIPVLEGYGLTETSPVVSWNTLRQRKYGTVGRPISGVEVDFGEDSEVLVRGKNVFQGYWQRPEETEKVIDRDGWLHTGDIGYLDKEGFLVLTDRKKNLLVLSTGKNVAPQPIENLLKTSHYISEIMVLGDNQRFLSALILPDFERLKEWAAEASLVYKDPEDLILKQQVIELYRKEIARLSKDLARFEQVREFTLLPRDFGLQPDTMTPTLKLRRDRVRQIYDTQIRRMYKSGG